MSKGRGSRLLKNLGDTLRRIASDAVREEVIEGEAKRLQTRMRRDLKPHRKTGLAENTAIAIGEPDRIILENISYSKYMKFYQWGRRIPYTELQKIARAWRSRMLKAIRGIR